MTGGTDFEQIFAALTGNPPYPWQCALHGEFCSGRFPPDINLPTGAGKTAIMAIWLATLARYASTDGPATKFPRRLVWVVDRRVVVDQATDEANRIRFRLSDKKNPQARALRRSLAVLSGNETSPLAISTLRGERADNREWSDDPARPAIIAGTVDMIGSRLLFSGYGDGKYWAAQHAGLLGQDTLLVNDEAHLTPAMAALLARIEDLSTGSPRPPRTIRISATHGAPDCWPKSLERDEKHQGFAAAYAADKRLHIEPTHAAQLERKAVELALALEDCDRTIIFVEKPEAARRIAAAIKKAVPDQARVLTLTGTMRGYERDCLTTEAAFGDFTARRRPASPCWLVATSAGEVGANISSERLITEASSLDHLLQRFGRANRFGETQATVHVLAPSGTATPAKGPKGEVAARIRAALEFLRALPAAADSTRDVSPKALFGRTLPPEACSPAPLLAPLLPWHVDNLSLTTLARHPARPAVEPWLQGKQDRVPETYVAWRNDVPYLTRQEVDTNDRKAALRSVQLLAHERLREPTYLLLKKLEPLAHKPDGEMRVLLCATDGSVEATSLRELLTHADATNRLAYAQLILPPGLAGLDGGVLVPEQPPSSQTAYDLSSIRPSEEPTQPWAPRGTCLLATESAPEGPFSLSYVSPPPGQLLAGAQPARAVPSLKLSDLRTFASQNGWRLLLRVALPAPEGSDHPDQDLLYFALGDAPAPSASRYALREHLAETAREAASIAARLGLSKDLAQALESAAELHDRGKEAPIWQQAAGNPDVAEPVAKSLRPMRGRELGGFRHELASLVAADAAHSELALERDLALHLIAAHHGHARPCFKAKTYDNRDLPKSRAAALATPRRFANLTRRFGPWGVAYLESLLRAADALASNRHQERAKGAAQ